VRFNGFRFLLSCIVLFSVVLPQPGLVANAQDLAARDKAAALLAKMTPSEKVGQLFLVTFTGTSTETTSSISQLITNQHIGGVVLRADNDNFIADDTTQAAHRLIQSLQQVNWDVSQTVNADSTTQGAVPVNYVPLFIGISQEGDLTPYDQLINGMTALPNQMAIGATWKPENAKTVGEILGEELSALGVNLLFGPSLDVLDVIKSDVSEDLGVRTFGGDPYWVAEMGKAYIKGVHEGSKDKIAVIATHFQAGEGQTDSLKMRLPQSANRLNN